MANYYLKNASGANSFKLFFIFYYAKKSNWI